MTNEELDMARAAEAKRLFSDDYYDVRKDKTLWDRNAVIAAARLAREGWTPPEPVDPDLVEAERCARNYVLRNAVRALSPEERVSHFLLAIKVGRELERAEADIEIDQLQETVMKLTQPGMVWVKHDRSKVCPIVGEVLARYDNGYFTANVAEYIHWPLVTHYASITQPKDAA